MDRLPYRIEELICGVANLPIAVQRERHIMLTKRMLEIATVAQVRSMREDCEMSPLCEFFGEEHRQNVLNMIDGHLALREMKVFRRHTEFDRRKRIHRGHHGAD